MPRAGRNVRDLRGGQGEPKDPEDDLQDLSNKKTVDGFELWFCDDLSASLNPDRKQVARPSPIQRRYPDLPHRHQRILASHILRRQAVRP